MNLAALYINFPKPPVLANISPHRGSRRGTRSPLIASEILFKMSIKTAVQVAWVLVAGLTQSPAPP